MQSFNNNNNNNIKQEEFSSSPSRIKNRSEDVNNMIDSSQKIIVPHSTPSFSSISNTSKFPLDSLGNNVSTTVFDDNYHITNNNVNSNEISKYTFKNGNYLEYFQIHYLNDNNQNKLYLDNNINNLLFYNGNIIDAPGSKNNLNLVYLNSVKKDFQNETSLSLQVKEENVENKIEIVSLNNLSNNNENLVVVPQIDEKLKSKRIRNRLAAHKCRNKKLNSIKVLEQRILELEKEIHIIQDENNKLAAYRNELRKKLINFSNCICKCHY